MPQPNRPTIAVLVGNVQSVSVRSKDLQAEIVRAPMGYDIGHLPQD
jgi:hypothetical protein